MILARRVKANGLKDQGAVSRVGGGGNHVALSVLELEGKLAGSELGAGQDLGATKGDGGRSGGVGVLKDNLAVGRRGLGREPAGAVVGDGDGDHVLGGVIRHALEAVLGLADHIGVGSGLVVLKGVKVHVALGVVGGGRHDFAILHQLERKLAGPEVAAGQGLGDLDVLGHAVAHGIGLVSVDKGGVAIDARLGGEEALTVVRDLDGHRADVGVIGDAHGAARDLADLVDVGSRLAKGHAREGHVAGGVIADGGGNVALGVLELELELAGDKCGRAARELLGKAQLHRGSDGLVGVLKLQGVLADVGGKGAVAVVGDDDGDGLGASRDSGDAGRQMGGVLRDGVGVRARGVEDKVVKGKVAVRVVGGVGDHFALGILELEAELASPEGAAGQGLVAREALTSE